MVVLWLIDKRGRQSVRQVREGRLGGVGWGGVSSGVVVLFIVD